MPIKEEWKQIKNYEGLYEVSNWGRVKNSRSYSLKTTSKKTMFGRCLNQRENNMGYLKVSLSKTNTTKSVFVHRLVAQAFISNDYEKPLVNHKDGNKKNNIYNNLEWVTPKENNIHAYKNGLIDLNTEKRRVMLRERQEKNKKQVIISDNKGRKLGEFSSLKDASLHFGKNEKYFSGVLKKGHSKYQVILKEEVIND